MTSSPVSLVDLKPDQFKEFMNSFDHVFSDCDGVIWISQTLPRAGEFYSLMKKHGKTVHYVSNNSIRSKQNYESKFKQAEIEDGFENLTTPSVAIAEYLKAANFNKTIYCVSCVETTNVLESYGFACRRGPNDGLTNFENYIRYLEDDLEIGAVVFDCDFEANMAKLHKAVTYLRRPDVLFLAGATDKHVYFKKGQYNLGCAIFTDVVAQEVKRDPIGLSKPHKLFGQFAMKKAGVTDPSRVLFIGDMIEQDVRLGKEIGFKTLLLLTNVTKDDMLAHEIKPDYYAESLASLVPLL